MQLTTAKSRLAYLLHESSEWEFLPREVRDDLVVVYQSRLDRLQSTDRKDCYLSWPETDWTSPLLTQKLALANTPRLNTEKLDRAALETYLETAPAALAGAAPTIPTAVPPSLPDATTEEPIAPPLALPLERPLQPTASEPSPSPSSQPLSPLRPEPVPASSLDIPPFPEQESLTSKVLAEADVRWFHSLGALLVIAAVIGWLRATWDGYGKNLACLLILFSPAALHATAYQMRRTVPLSSRLLAILAGMLTPPALLSIHVFDFLPPSVSGRDYWTLALLVSGSLLLWQAHSMKEKTPLFLGALCVIMSGWSQGSLVTSAVCLMVGFALAPLKPDPSHSEEEAAWRRELQQVGFASGAFGAMAALFVIRPGQGSLTPLLAFTGALIYLHLPTLTRQADGSGSGRVIFQATISTLGILLMRAVLDIPASGVALFTLMAAGLFLSARPEHEAGLLALRFGSLLGLLGLAIGFLSSNPIGPNESEAETLMRFLLGLVGAGLFGYLSRVPHLESQANYLRLGAVLSTLGGWYHLVRALHGPFDGGHFAPLLASFGLWVVIWLLAARWLRPQEHSVVESVSLTVLLISIGLGILPMLGLLLLAAEKSSHPTDPTWTTWAYTVLWLGLVSLLWERGYLRPQKTPVTEPLGATVGESLAETNLQRGAQDILLPRLALWALSLGGLFLATLPWSYVPPALQLLGLALLLSPALPYRQPGLEMVWLVAPLSFALQWQSGLFPAQIALTYLLFAASWAAGPTLRPASFLLSAGTGMAVILSGLDSTSHIALLTLPLLYAVCVALPVPGRGEWTSPHPAQYGFDLLLNLGLFLPLTLTPGSPESFLAALAAPLLAFALYKLALHPYSRRVVTPQSAAWLLLAGFVWSLAQGPKESGLLLFLSSFGVFRLKNPTVSFDARDLANALAILGLSWLASDSFFPQVGVLGLAVLASEILALLWPRWKPNLSNAAFLIYLLGQAPPISTHPETAVVALAGLIAGVRGIASVQLVLAATGWLTVLKTADDQLAFLDVSFKVRLLPLAIVVLAISFWLWLNPEHPSRQRLGFQPLAGIRTGIALLSLPALLSLAVAPNITDFAWVMAVGCSCLVLAYGFPGADNLGPHFKQAGGYVLTGWVGVSLGRSAMILPWQLATLVVGVVLVGVGIKVEKNRKAAKSLDEGE